MSRKICEERLARAPALVAEQQEHSQILMDSVLTDRDKSAQALKDNIANRKKQKLLHCTRAESVTKRPM